MEIVNDVGDDGVVLAVQTVVVSGLLLVVVKSTIIL